MYTMRKNILKEAIEKLKIHRFIKSHYTYYIYYTNYKLAITHY